MDLCSEHLGNFITYALSGDMANAGMVAGVLTGTMEAGLMLRSGDELMLIMR